MRGGSGILLVAVGLLILYLAATGGLSRLGQGLAYILRGTMPGGGELLPKMAPGDATGINPVPPTIIPRVDSIPGLVSPVPGIR